MTKAKEMHAKYPINVNQHNLILVTVDAFILTKAPAFASEAIKSLWWWKPNLEKQLNWKSQLCHSLPDPSPASALTPARHNYFCLHHDSVRRGFTGKLLAEQPPKPPGLSLRGSPSLGFPKAETRFARRLRETKKVTAGTVTRGCVAGTSFKWQLPQCRVTLGRGTRRSRRGCEGENHLVGHEYRY